MAKVRWPECLPCSKSPAAMTWKPSNASMQPLPWCVMLMGVLLKQSMHLGVMLMGMLLRMSVLLKQSLQLSVLMLGVLLQQLLRLTA